MMITNTQTELGYVHVYIGISTIEITLFFEHYGLYWLLADDSFFKRHCLTALTELQAITAHFAI